MFEFFISRVRVVVRPKRMGLALVTGVTLALVACGGESGGSAPIPSGPGPSATAYAIGGDVSGLVGSGLVLQNNAGDDLPQAADGSFRFATNVAGGAAYAVTVKAQPSSPTQTCTVNNANGSVASADVDNVKVICATHSYPIGGKVTGLLGSGLVLQNNGADDLAVAADGSLVFAQPVASAAAYAVAVKTQPTAPAQTCSVGRASGTVGTHAVSDLTVICSTRSFTVSGTVSGLAGTGLVLQNNAGDDLAVTADGGLGFAVPVASGAPYVVSVKTQPSAPAQTCTVSNASGAVSDNNVSNVSVLCSTDTHTVSGTVSGLVAGSTLTLQNNAADTLSITANGSFHFATPVVDRRPYLVTVYTQPSIWQSCSVTGGSGTATADVTGVTLACSAPQAQVSTLAGSGTEGSDNGTGPAATFEHPNGVAVDASGNVYVGDTKNHRIRKITPAGDVSTLAGSGTWGWADATGPAASFYYPYGVAVDASGTVYVADSSNHRIRKITPTGVVSTLAGSGSPKWADGSGSAASFNYPQSVAVDASGNVYVADFFNHLIRRITSAGDVSTLAGTETWGSDNGLGSVATFRHPHGVAVGANGDVYVADTRNNLIRKITPVP